MRIRTVILSVIASSFCFQVVAQQTSRITPSGIGYLEYLPDDYHSNSNKYPLVVFLHGYREKGASSTDPKLIMRELPRAASVGLPKYVKNGKKYPFILITPQLKRSYGTWPSSYVKNVIDHVRKELRIDEKRIYLTGLSLGGFGVWRTAGDYPQLFAAIAPVCAGGNAMDKASAIARENVAVWGFHGGNDYVVSHTVTTRMVNAINSAPKKPNPLAKVTIFPGMGHVIWDKAYKETEVLEWLLTFRNGSNSNAEPPSNSHPVANAGPDKFITLPANSVTIHGSGSDKDGEIVSYSWTKASGGPATVRQNDSKTLLVEGLEEGAYLFRLTVRDNDGAAASDNVSVVVKAGAANKAPVANAGPDLFIKLPNDRIMLHGKATDDNKIVAYQWTQTAGAPAVLKGPNTATLTVSGLREGAYRFRFTVTDDDGSTASDDALVNVTASEDKRRSVEILPAASNGNRLPDRRITLPGGSARRWLRW